MVIEGVPLVDGVATAGADVVAIAPGEITIAGSCTAAASIKARSSARFQRDAGGQFVTLNATGSYRYERHQLYRRFESGVGLVDCTIDEVRVTTGESGSFDGTQLTLAGPTIYTYDRQGTPVCDPISISEEYVGEETVGPRPEPVTIGDEVVEYRFMYDRESHEWYHDGFGGYEFVDDVYQSTGSLVPGS